MKTTRLLILIFTLLSLTACEKVSLEELLGSENKEETGNNGNNTNSETSVTLRVKGLDAIVFNEQKTTENEVQLADVCTRLSVALYQNGERLFYKNQKSTDDSFGTIQLSIAEGEYTLLVLGYSNTDAATTTNLQKITFGGKVTDTFHYCQTISLTKENSNIDITLKRITGMFQLVIQDDIPDNVAQLKFYYTGGSSTLDGLTAYGCVNSRQTEYREVTENQNTFEIYTFPQEEAKPLNIKVTALDAKGNTIHEREFSDVTVNRNYMNVFTGTFFDGTQPSSKEMYANIKVDPTWEGRYDNTY